MIARNNSQLNAILATDAHDNEMMAFLILYLVVSLEIRCNL